jgi:SAM-dependent methyltransferase
MRVDPTNAEQAHAWNGKEGTYWAENAQHFDRAVAGYHDMLMERAAITSEERVLDIGCGTGQTTRDAARAASEGLALGVDLSGRMIDLARQCVAEENLRNATFEHVDAQIHPFPAGSFDLAIRVRARCSSATLQRLSPTLPKPSARRAGW